MVNEPNRRSTGNVMEPGDGYLADGVTPDLSPTAGYKAAEPVQYADESDTQFADRVAQWESAKASAENIAKGGLDFEAQKKALKVRYDADVAALEATAKREVKHAPGIVGRAPEAVDRDARGRVI